MMIITITILLIAKYHVLCKSQNDRESEKERGRKKRTDERKRRNVATLESNE